MNVALHSRMRNADDWFGFLPLVWTRINKQANIRSRTGSLLLCGYYSMGVLDLSGYCHAKQSRMSDPEWVIQNEWSRMSDPEWVIQNEWSRMSDPEWVIRNEWSGMSDPEWRIRNEWSRMKDPEWMIRNEQSGMSDPYCVIQKGWSTITKLNIILFWNITIHRIKYIFTY